MLVDGHDKPLLDAMGDQGRLDHNWGVLKGFFSVLKKSDEHRSPGYSGSHSKTRLLSDWE